MSFEELSVKRIVNVATIDGLPYPPPVTPITLPSGHIPVGTGTFPPLQDSGVSITNGTVGHTGKFIDFWQAAPGSYALGYGHDDNLFAFSAQGSNGADADLVFNQQSTTARDISFFNVSGGDTDFTTTGTGTIRLQPTGTGGVVITPANSGGTAGQVLTTDGSGNSTWQSIPASSIPWGQWTQSSTNQTIPADGSAVSIIWDTQLVNLFPDLTQTSPTVLTNNTNTHVYSVVVSTGFGNALGNLAGTVFYQSYLLVNGISNQAASGFGNPPDGFGLTFQLSFLVTLPAGGTLEIQSQMFGSVLPDTLGNSNGRTTLYITQIS
jgi:hypothetical protein